MPFFNFAYPPNRRVRKTIRFMFSYMPKSLADAAKEKKSNTKQSVCVSHVDLVASTIVVLDIMLLKIYTTHWLHTNGHCAVDVFFFVILSPRIVAG